MSPKNETWCEMRGERAKKGLCVRGGVSFEPPEGGGGGGVAEKGALMTGQSKEASLKALTMTHHLRCKAARQNFFQKKNHP